MPMIAIARRAVTAQATLFVPYTTSMPQLSGRIDEGLGKVYAAVAAQGLTPAGPPFVRYLAMNAGMADIEVGVPVTAAGRSAGEIHTGELPGGVAAVAVHAGAYDNLRETYRAMERWVADEGLRFGGAPWESYLTDPHRTPDQADWRTEIYWPLAQ